MEIKLNTAYASRWDNIQYPIFELADGSYLCITCEYSRRLYHINIYTTEDFIEQGFEERDAYNDLFENLSAADFHLL